MDFLVSWVIAKMILFLRNRACDCKFLAPSVLQNADHTCAYAFSEISPYLGVSEAHFRFWPHDVIRNSRRNSWEILRSMLVLKCFHADFCNLLHSCKHICDTNLIPIIYERRCNLQASIIGYFIIRIFKLWCPELCIENMVCVSIFNWVHKYNFSNLYSIKHYIYQRLQVSRYE